MDAAAPGTIGSARARWTAGTLAILSLLAGVGILYLTSYKSFYYDEWDFINSYRPGEASSVFLPHVEHWSTIPILIWKVLMLVFGLRTHLPYEALAVAGHIACVALLFTLVRRWSGPLPAFGAATILLVLGTGATDIIWAFQMAWTLSIALGLTAMLIVDTTPPGFSAWRAVAIGGTVLASLMSSGIGLGFLAAVAARLLLDRSHRIYLVSLVVPAVAYLVWFYFYGAGLAGTPGAPCPTCDVALRDDLTSITADFAVRFAAFVATALSASAAAVFGQVGITVGIATLVFLILLVAHFLRQRKVKPWEAALGFGLVAQFGIIALARTRFGLGAAIDPHYLYVGAVYLLPLLAGAVKDLPWRGVWRVAVTSAFVLAVLSNALLLVDQAVAQRELMRTQNAELQTTELLRGAPDMAMNAEIDSDIMPQVTPANYYGDIDALGSPVPSSTPRALSELPAGAVDHVLVALFSPAFTLTPFGGPPGEVAPCQTIDSSGGSTTDLHGADGGSIIVTSSSGGGVFFSLGFMAAPSKPLLLAQLPAGKPMALHLPDTGRSIQWRVRIAAPNIGTLTLCGADGVESHPGGIVLTASGADGTMSPGWAAVADPQASNGHAAKLIAGSHTDSFLSDSFGTPTPLPVLTYDVWYRIRVGNASGLRPELLAGLWDVDGGHWVGSTQLVASDVGTTYEWIRVADHVTPVAGHHLVFIAALANDPMPAATDWYVDAAAVTLAGSSAPG